MITKESMKRLAGLLWNIATQLFPLIVGATAGFFVGNLTVPPGIDQLKWNIISTTLGSLIVDKLWAIGQKLEERHLNAAIERANSLFEGKLNSLLENWIIPLSNSLDRFSPYFAFHTEHGRLESLLRQSENIQSKAKWVVPLFVSHKITQDFDSGTEVRIKTDIHGYSDIVEKLLPFATQSIYMTCPYTPKDWFTALLCDNSQALSDALCNKLKYEQFPGHVKAFLNAKAQDAKKRFVIIPQKKINEFFDPQHRQALKCFLKFSNSKYGITTRLAYEGNLCKGCSNSCDLARADYQVWDRSAVVELVDQHEGDIGKKEKEAVEAKTCRLLLHPEAKYLRLFDKCFEQYGQTMSAEDFLTFLRELEGLQTQETRVCLGVRINKDTGVMQDSLNSGAYE